MKTKFVPTLRFEYHHQYFVVHEACKYIWLVQQNAIKIFLQKSLKPGRWYFSAPTQTHYQNSTAMGNESLHLFYQTLYDDLVAKTILPLVSLLYMVYRHTKKKLVLGIIEMCICTYCCLSLIYINHHT